MKKRYISLLLSAAIILGLTVGFGMPDAQAATEQQIETNTISASQGVSLFIDADGVLWRYGYRPRRDLDPSGSRNTVTRIAEDVVSVSAGNLVSFAVKSDGSLWVWGSNLYGTLGIGTTTQIDTNIDFSNIYCQPTPQKIMDSVVAVAAALMGEHVMAIKMDGSLWTWGQNRSGELCDGTTINRYTPGKALDNVMLPRS